MPVLLLLIGAAACSGRDTAEEERRLSLRLEHDPPGRARAGTEAEIRALVQSSLEGSRLEARLRLLSEDGSEQRIPMELSPGGEALARIPARPRGAEVRYVIEARDAAGLLVALPRDAAEGGAYRLRFEGSSSRVLGGIAYLSALAGTLAFLGAGAAGVQTLRGRMSAGPAGLLGGIGAAAVVVGLLGIGAVHAFQVAGRPWPSSPVLLAMSRGDLAIVSLLWAGNLFLGRRALLEEPAAGAPPGERRFAVVAVAASLLTLFLLLF